ncbi:15-methylpalmitoyl-4-hydroxy-2-pyrone synthase [Thermolongibacillus altinsuensis]|uniref:15-methylpalmitoyl-4-hydroxy-2-pyrone synthase n=1 Tax=Thermolongibacillus altinsuensis TaxID=575256 RepID=A0A4R1QDW4_9BACL|nr:15-methylpalmitoyl-4-hydroxy-2-pyrone synthase [Thermolongibacillus altinsuensis]
MNKIPFLEKYYNQRSIGGVRVPAIVSVGLASLPYRFTQKEIMNLTRQLFENDYDDIDRLLRIFSNGQIESRCFVQPLEWYIQKHSFSEKNDLYIECAVRYGAEAIEQCLKQQNIDYKDIEAIFYISSTGIATPSIEARIMNQLPFSAHAKRIPIWGLGCAGGAAGLARAFEYCRAYPKAKVIVLAVEFCSLTFQLDDHSKSNFIGTSLFADGAGCVCVAGDNVLLSDSPPSIMDVQSTLMPHSEDVMGWDIKDQGFYVVFSKDIPSIIRKSFKEMVASFLQKHRLTVEDIHHFIVHPGGKKVLDAYRDSLQLSHDQIKHSVEVLKHYGNMSSVTVYVVLQKFMKQRIKKGEIGLMVALGPGFSCELLLLEWR